MGQTNEQGKTYCQDCKFCVPAPHGFTGATCSAPGVAEALGNNYDRFVARELDVVPAVYCSVARVSKCGPEAKLFEAVVAEAAE